MRLTVWRRGQRVLLTSPKQLLNIISFVLVIGWEEDFGATERLGKEEDFVHCRGLAAVGLETNPEYTTRRKTPDRAKSLWPVPKHEVYT